jgi:hypothetical protein
MSAARIAIALGLAATYMSGDSPVNDAGLRRALRWFPLVGWARPACPALGERVAELATIIRDAREPGADTRSAAANALNKAALLASDCGMPDLASNLCWQAHRRLPTS